MKLINSTVPKFLLVGVINTIVGAGLMFLLYNVFHVSYWISSCCNYIAGGIVSYFLNKYFTFKNQKKSIKQIILFIINLAFCYFIAYFLAKKIIYFAFSDFSVKILDNISMFCGMILYTGLNYFGQRFIVFKYDSQAEAQITEEKNV